MKTSPYFFIYFFTLVGLSIVPIMLSKVVLPPPEVPKIIINSPSLTSKETPNMKEKGYPLVLLHLRHPVNKFYGRFERL